MKALLPIYHTKVTAILAQVGILIMVTVFLASCGNKLSGTYNVDANGGMPFKKMNFTSDTKVELTVKFSEATAEADYLIEDDKVKISAAGQTQVFTIDKNGCLDGGQMIGKFCK